MQKKIYLNLFLVSFVIMGLEMTATRLIAPTFGNTVYTWGIVISVFLIGSSLGYTLGGNLADRKDALEWMRWFYVMGMLFIGLIPLIKSGLFPHLGFMSSILGTTIGVLILYFIPNILFSMIATMLMKIGLDGGVSGKAIGNLHTSSALGSVLGTLVTTFLFIPLTDINSVIAIFAVMIFLPYLFYFKAKKKMGTVLLVLPILSIFLPFVPGNLPLSGIIHEETSLYHDIQVFETSEFEGMTGNFRYMRFGNEDTIQGMMNMDNPETLVLDYTQSIWEAVERHASNSGSMFMIGHGIGSLTRQFEKEIEVVKVAELDKDVLDVSREYFQYEGNSVEIGDGRKILQEQYNPYDVIVLDAYHNTNMIPFHLITKEFFTLTNEKLKDDGILIINAIGRPEDDPVIESMDTTLRSVFEEVHILAEYDRDEWQNLLIIASKEPLNLQPVNGLTPVSVKEGEVILDEDTKLRNLN